MGSKVMPATLRHCHRDRLSALSLIAGTERTPWGVIVFSPSASSPGRHAGAIDEEDLAVAVVSLLRSPDVVDLDVCSLACRPADVLETQVDTGMAAAESGRPLESASVAKAQRCADAELGGLP
ncbi:hypothetical protein [Aminobacter aminovorans]|uniref:hypothetical protein n=1 Tax=Aminobacter aminovorans TaxID=83263 RepID=UPI0010534249|nr:hypothetical protein [Aminobacter aminovorans]